MKLIYAIVAKLKVILYYNPDETYLAMAKDHADLERRMRNLEYKRSNPTQFL